MNPNPEKLILPSELKLEKGEGLSGKVEREQLEANYKALREYARDLQELINNLDQATADKMVDVPSGGQMRLADLLQETFDKTIWLDKEGNYTNWNLNVGSEITDMAKVEAMQKMLDEVQSISPFFQEDFSDGALPNAKDLDLNDRLLDLESKTVTEQITPADYILLRSRLKRLSDYFERESGKDFYDEDINNVDSEKNMSEADKKALDEVRIKELADLSLDRFKNVLAGSKDRFKGNLQKAVNSGELEQFLIKANGLIVFQAEDNVSEDELLNYSDGSITDFVKSIQTHLAAKGYADKLKYSKNDGIDGLFGPRTMQSLKGYLAEDKEAANAEPTVNEGASAAKGGTESKSGGGGKNPNTAPYVSAGVDLNKGIKLDYNNSVAAEDFEKSESNLETLSESEFFQFTNNLAQQPGFILKSIPDQRPVKYDIVTRLNKMLNSWGLRDKSALKGVDAMLIPSVDLFNDGFTLDYSDKNGQLIVKFDINSLIDKDKHPTFTMDLGLFKSQYLNNPAGFTDFVKGKYNKTLGRDLDKAQEIALNQEKIYRQFKEAEIVEREKAGEKRFENFVKSTDKETISYSTKESRLNISYKDKMFMIVSPTKGVRDGMMVYDSLNDSVSFVSEGKPLFVVNMANLNNENKRKPKLEKLLKDYIDSLSD